MRRRFQTLDVFTDTPLAGNPLAVVHDAGGLDDGQMQAIAREFNLSETVFVLDPHYPVNTARLRIFTPSAELPFAGHPTIGAAIAIAQARAPDLLARSSLRVVLEEKIGDVICDVMQKRGSAALASFELPLLPHEVDGPMADAAALAAALSILPDDIGFDDHVPSRYSAGVSFTFVPLKTRAAIAQAKPDLKAWADLAQTSNSSVFIYAPEVDQEGHAFSARMFAPLLGIAEDPATGAAIAALAGAIVAFDRPEDGEHSLMIEQGFDMGRGSLIHLTLHIEHGRLAKASIGGSAVVVQDGTLSA